MNRLPHQAPAQEAVPPHLIEDVCDTLQRAGGLLQWETDRLLRESGITASQYNAISILTQAGSGGLSCGQIAELMPSHDPDVTRIVDKLERRGLVSRSRDERDRRVIRVRITREGNALLARLRPRVMEARTRPLRAISAERLEALLDLLGKVVLPNGETGADDPGGATNPGPSGSDA